MWAATGAGSCNVSMKARDVGSKNCWFHIRRAEGTIMSKNELDADVAFELLLERLPFPNLRRSRIFQ